MPRLSLWNPRKGNDYKYIDKVVKASFDHGGTALLVHKYIGTGDGNETKIQDMLFMENRDRNYDDTIYELRATYNITDQDFDLSQFGMFLGSDQQIFMVHINTMVEMIGRKIMSGDVVELPHMRDDLLLDENAKPVNQYWVVQEATKASEGFSPGWWPHIWRIRCKQLQDTQEYSDIFGTGENADDLKNLLSTYNKELEITDAIVAEAEVNVPGPYYDWDTNNLMYAGEGENPNDLDWSTVTSGTAFPSNPQNGEYFLRVDYKPHRLFQYVDGKWYKVEDDNDGAWRVGNKLHQLHINNENTFTADDGTTQTSKVNLSKAVKPRID